MTYIPDQQLEQIRDATDLVRLVSEHVPLKKAGRNYKGLCPFHSEKTPSFVVSPEKQIFHCFGCGEGGDAFQFLVKIEGASFIEAVQALADQAGIKLTSQKGARGFAEAKDKKLLLKVNRIAAEFFFNELHQGKEGRQALAYLEKRQIQKETIHKFLLGYAPESSRSLTRHLESKRVPPALAEKAELIRKGADGTYYDFFRKRLIFPIRNLQGDFIGFGGRILEASSQEQSKYINTADSPVYHKRRELYGLFEGKTAMRQQRKALIAEGYLDVLALAQNGFEGSVAPLGTALTAEQVGRLHRQVSEFLVVFDGDAAGEKAAWQVLSMTLPEQVPTRIVRLPAGEDPDSFLKAHGKETFAGLVACAPGLMDYFIDTKAAEAGSNNLGKIQAVRELLPILMAIPGQVEKTLYIRRLAERTGLPEEAVRKELHAFKGSRRNFPGAVADGYDAKRQSGQGLSLFEKDILQAVFLGVSEALTLSQEIVPEDWRHPELIKLWPRLRQDLDKKVSAAKILAEITDPLLKKGLAELILNERKEEGESAEEFVNSCRQTLKKQHWEAKRQDLTQKIREAEVAADQKKMEALLAEKNRLIREMNQADLR